MGCSYFARGDSLLAGCSAQWSVLDGNRGWRDGRWWREADLSDSGFNLLHSVILRVIDYICFLMNLIF